MSEQRNLVLAIALSVAIILAFEYFYEIPRRQRLAQQQAQQPVATQTAPQEEARVPGPGAMPDLGEQLPETALRSVPRAPVDNPRVSGSVDLVGARIDDLVLDDYHVEPDSASPRIRLLHPAGTARAYFAEFGWTATDRELKLPGPDTPWQVVSGKVAPGETLVLRWDNGEGVVFEQRIGIDSDYMFTVERRVINNTDRPLTLYPYGLVSRRGTPQTLGYYILHEGPIGVVEGRLHEIDYTDLVEDGPQRYETTGGWLGITDKYWLVALVPDQREKVTVTFRHVDRNGTPVYQTDFVRPAVTVQPGGEAAVTDRVFAGAKEVELLDRYEAELGIPLFDRAVDFGWFYFLTKPIFYMLHYLYKWTGNYGVAILIMTLLVRLAMFPLANKSFRAMNRMKQLQPEMMRIRELYENDRERINRELMELYRREKVNPAAGCLPIVIQIPIFFALYKVLFVSIEMRHAPFFGWIRDLSAPDPTNLFNLFGLLPWDPPGFLHVGALPLVMGFTMWLQQKLNPQPADPVQAKLMNLLPVMFTFLFAQFPAGLVLYWTWSNILAIAQQWFLHRQMEREEAAKAGRAG
ncbi:Membrane protein insertase YidC [bacterium HR39]|nr:Membrane protein insertase YidC [bacterium HR39]